MSPVSTAAKAKPAVVDAADIGTAVGVVPVFPRLPELGEPLSHTRYDLHGTHHHHKPSIRPTTATQRTPLRARFFSPLEGTVETCGRSFRTSPECTARTLIPREFSRLD